MGSGHRRGGLRQAEWSAAPVRRGLEQVVERGGDRTVAVVAQVHRQVADVHAGLGAQVQPGDPDFEEVLAPVRPLVRRLVGTVSLAQRNEDLVAAVQGVAVSVQTGAHHEVAVAGEQPFQSCFVVDHSRVFPLYWQFR